MSRIKDALWQYFFSARRGLCIGVGGHFNRYLQTWRGIRFDICRFCGRIKVGERR